MTVNPDAASELAMLRAAPAGEQDVRGYAHTLREILQQPATWIETVRLLWREAARLRAALEPAPASIVLTGSGSSHFIGECLAAGLQQGLGVPVRAIDAGTLLTHASGVLPPGPVLLVSIARSGDSPESAAVVDTLLREAPQCRHLFLTCNARGRLATGYVDEPRVTCVVLDDATDDRSLVMTSSFTNLFLAGRALAMLERPEDFSQAAVLLASAAQRMLEQDADALAAVAREDFDSVVYLGSGGRFGVAREAALKMLEMTAGSVHTFAESYLGLRHGPMSVLDGRTLVVGFLSTNARVRDYELDLLRELRNKRLGARRVLVGEQLPRELLGAADVAIELPMLAPWGEDEALPLHVLAGQLLALFRCLKLGRKPDSPADGVLSRVVEPFAIHHGTVA